LKGRSMDPNANLKEQLDIARKLLDDPIGEDDVDRLAELVVALDEWISNGGFLPKRWQTPEVRP
jgi:hypothetical protein